MSATSPITTPACMASRVFLPTTDAGALRSTIASCAAASDSAFADSFTPGAMMPPTNEPPSSTTSKFVVVPRSTTMKGAV